MNLCLKWSQIILENQVNRSQLCVASPHLPQSGEMGAIVWGFFCVKMDDDMIKLNSLNYST